MSFRQTGRIAVLVSLGLAVAACGKSSPGPDTSAATGAAPVAEGTQPIGQIASGTSEPVPTVAEPEAVEQEGIARVTSLTDAMDKVKGEFTVLTPKTFSGNAYLDAVRYIVPFEGKTDPNLPAVMLIYSLEAGGSVVVRESKATGAGIEGTDVAIGTHAAKQTSSEPLVFAWEQDGVRVEIRGTGIDAESLKAVGASLEPATAADAEGVITAPQAPAETPTPASP